MPIYRTKKTPLLCYKFCWAVKNKYCSCWGPKFNSQHLGWAQFLAATLNIISYDSSFKESDISGFLGHLQLWSYISTQIYTKSKWNLKNLIYKRLQNKISNYYIIQMKFTVPKIWEGGALSQINRTKSRSRVLPGIFLAQPIMCTSSLSASLVRDIIMEASVKGMLGRLTSTLGGSASRRVSTSCSGLRVLSSSSFTRGTCPLFLLVLPRQCTCSPELLCLRTIRYPHLSLLDPKEESRCQIQLTE